MVWKAALILAASTADHADFAEVVNGKTGKEVAALVAAGCADRSWQIVVNSDSMVECHYTEGTAEAEQVDALIGAFSGRRGYSTFIGVARFAIIDLGGSVRVQATDAMVATSAFGRSEERRGSQSQAITEILRSSGAERSPFR